MNVGLEGDGARSCWFVGASYGKAEDQSQRFVDEGIWENGYEDRYLDQVKSIRPGDRIAIKAAYTRKRDLPFDNRGQTVSVMAIKAVGTVSENLGDGRRLRVSWTPVEPPREWYFYTNRSTIWRVLPGEWMTDALIAFAFHGTEQEIGRFRNAPYWRERFGDIFPGETRFQWTRFFEAVADKLLAFQHKRPELVAGLHEIASRVDGLSNLDDQYADGTKGPLKDICPFTTFGLFNRGITDARRKTIAGELAAFLGVDVPVPQTFEGIPVLNNMNSRYFCPAKDRGDGDIDTLWSVFAAAMEYAPSPDPDTRTVFVSGFDAASECAGVRWNLTFGLYWIRPWTYASLDQKSREYVEQKLGLEIKTSGPGGRCTGSDYLALLDALNTRFLEDTYPVHSFPELSLESWRYATAGPPIADPQKPKSSGKNGGEEPPATNDPPAREVYTVGDILSEGSFLDRGRIEELLERLRAKKNLILQGPPGTGKTWLAKRLAFALMGERDERRLCAVQFHANLSYEDFVRGWRPSGDGKLDLVDGPFLAAIAAASKDPERRYVFVIEEINRGNPAQVFGEMLTLLDADKRTPSEALELCYRRSDHERVHIPDNLYVIGTMNIADRSLALVDFALRRRFAFADLEPVLGNVWREWVSSRFGVDTAILTEIEKRLLALNEVIASDANLGRQFRIGHSYVTPTIGSQIKDAQYWFRQVVSMEIGPLLDEYWFDCMERARDARKRLVEGF